MNNRLCVILLAALAGLQMAWAQTSKVFYIMIPPDFTEWMSAVPMLSMDGGVTGAPMTAVEDMCGWFSYSFAEGEVTDNVVVYRSDDPDREDVIGVNGNWETASAATPIPLSIFFNMGIDSLFFVPDVEQKTNEDGFYYSADEVDGIEGYCSYTLAAIIYDTDALLHPAFSCWVAGGEGCQYGAQGIDATTAQAAVNACIGITPGIVESELDASVPQQKRKPKLTTLGKQCFVDSKYFDQLFRPTAGVNEMSCFDMPFGRAADGKWEFNSDDYKGPGMTVKGGFYPVEASTDSIIRAADPTQTPVSAARKKRLAESPVRVKPEWEDVYDPVEGVPKIDLYCNGPGWDGGVNCGGAPGTGKQYQLFNDGEYPSVWDWSSRQSVYGWPENTERNQHFCFESHAKFTYRKGFRFSIRGDDDIWVFIDRKLAVDLGGTHLAAPGYVNLDEFVGASGKLENGDEYDLDIFVCDRRTTMSNVRIKTNMYIQQKTAINLRRNVYNKSEQEYSICYTESGDGSCAALSGDNTEKTLCGEDIGNSGLKITYTLVKGNSLSSGADIEFENEAGKVLNCGIDLTNPAAPKINKDNICGLGGGRYTLFVNIDGKSKKVATFRMSGEVDVIYKNGVALDTTGKEIPGGKYTLLQTAMAGQMVPVYVSSVAPASDGKDEVDIYPEDAKGVEYTLAYDRVMKVYEKQIDPATGTESYVKLASGTSRKIGDSGVDTVYATVGMDDMTEAIHTYSISVSGKPQNAMNIKFYLPQIAFIEKIPSEGEIAKSVTGQRPEPDGTYEEYWVGTLYDMYLAVLKPNEDGKTYSLCMEECDGLDIHKGAGTSPRIDFNPDKVTFKDGYAKISVRSQTAYRWDADPSILSPATIVAEYNDYVQAVYNPMYFRDPPAPYPVLADVFDVHGSTSFEEYKIPAPYFDTGKEYLDGIGDSVAIYYDRPLHKDSLPTRICVLWDTTDAEAHNPYTEGFSTIPRDTSIVCNELVSIDADNIDCSHPSAEGFCSNLITIGGLKLSSMVKTAGIGTIRSYSVFGDKGKKVKQGFVGVLIDRIAPVPLSAGIRSIMNGDGLSDFDSLVVILSEPVKLVTTSKKKSSLDFYLNSAQDLSEENRYMSALSDAQEVSAAYDPTTTVIPGTGEGRVKFLYRHSKVSPHVGDYLRLGGDLKNIFWSDTTDLSLFGGDTLRVAADSAYYWNSPTGYKEKKRLSSRWIPIVSNDAELVEKDDDFEYADPTFRVVMTAPFEFTIVLDWNSTTAVSKKYAVMDLQGRILKQGTISSSEIVVPVQTAGSYVVKVGHGKRIVNVH